MPTGPIVQTTGLIQAMARTETGGFPVNKTLTKAMLYKAKLCTTIT